MAKNLVPVGLIHYFTESRGTAEIRNLYFPDGELEKIEVATAVIDGESHFVRLVDPDCGWYYPKQDADAFEEFLGTENREWLHETEEWMQWQSYPEDNLAQSSDPRFLAIKRIFEGSNEHWRLRFTFSGVQSEPTKFELGVIKGDGYEWQTIEENGAVVSGEYSQRYVHASKELFSEVL